MTSDEIERAALALNRLDMPDTAALIRRLRDERNEARNKALDEAASVARTCLGPSLAGVVSDAILALKSPAQEPKP